VGPKDVENGTVVVARRDNGAKEVVPQGNVADVVIERLADIQKALLEKVSLSFLFYFRYLFLKNQ
jgi:prolyl-tRNA synthetase